MTVILFRVKPAFSAKIVCNLKFKIFKVAIFLLCLQSTEFQDRFWTFRTHSQRYRVSTTSWTLAAYNKYSPVSVLTSHTLCAKKLLTRKKPLILATLFSIQIATKKFLSSFEICALLSLESELSLQNLRHLYSNPLLTSFDLCWKKRVSTWPCGGKLNFSKEAAFYVSILPEHKTHQKCSFPLYVQSTTRSKLEPKFKTYSNYPNFKICQITLLHLNLQGIIAVKCVFFISLSFWHFTLYTECNRLLCKCQSKISEILQRWNFTCANELFHRFAEGQIKRARLSTQDFARNIFSRIFCTKFRFFLVICDKKGCIFWRRKCMRGKTFFAA